jgi:hypothetical protein
MARTPSRRSWPRFLPTPRPKRSTSAPARSNASRALRDPSLDFDTLLFTKRVPGSYSHMSDQYYGWWSRPGGGIYLLKNFKSGEPTTVCLTDALFKEPGSFLRPALSYDAKKVIFAWCRHYPALAKENEQARQEQRA